MTFILAQIFGLLATTFNIIGVQSKKKKQILIFFIISNLCFAINFIFLKSYTGAIINFIAAIQTFINYQYERKEKTLPNYLITIYLATVITCGVAFYRQVIDILPIVCSVLYTLTIVQKKEKNIRSLTLITTILWLIYDFIVGAYTAAISNIIFGISNLIAIFKYDIKMIRKYEKLVRDKIPDVIKQDGRSYRCEVLDDKRYREELDKKLLEEANEFVQDHSVEEMADLWEVIEAIMKNRKISKEQVEEVKRKKQEKRGAFDKKLFLIEAEEKKG